MVFKIHELQGMERSFSKYRRETERLCLRDTQVMGHLRRENLVNPIIWHGIDPFPSPPKKRLCIFFTFQFQEYSGLGNQLKKFSSYFFLF